MENMLPVQYKVAFPSLETVVDGRVSSRAFTMQELRSKGCQGRSPYKMAVLRPHHAGMDDYEIRSLVNDIKERTGLPLEIVNYNVKGRQYAVTGRIEALDELAMPWPPDASRVIWRFQGLDVPFPFHTPG